MQQQSSFQKRILVVLLLTVLFVWTKRDELNHYSSLRSSVPDQVVINDEDLLLQEFPEIPSLQDMEELNEIEIPFQPFLEEQLLEHQLELEKQYDEMEKFWKKFKAPVD